MTLGSLPEWLSALTGIAALGVSIWAVRLVKRTLEATRAAVASSNEAVATARDIGEAQVRAYLYCEEASYQVWDKDGPVPEWESKGVGARITLKNAGSSPALDVEMTGSSALLQVIGFPERPKVDQWANSSENRIHYPPIISGGSATETLSFFIPYDFLDEEGQSRLMDGIDQHLKHFNEIEFYFIVKWKDVFGKSHSFSGELREVIDASPKKPAKRRSNEGPLEVRQINAEFGVPSEADQESESKTDPA